MGLFSQLPGNVIHIPGSFPNFPNILFNTFLWKAGKYSQRAWDLWGNWVLIPNSLEPIPNELLGLENEQRSFLKKIPLEISHFPNQCQRIPAGFPRFEWESSLNIYFSKVTVWLLGNTIICNFTDFLIQFIQDALKLYSKRLIRGKGA